MSTYPILASMGVQNPLQIAGYTLSQPRPDSDILRIKYTRPKGSFLPITRSYTFGRASRVQVKDSGTGLTGQVFEISPTLSTAISELDSIVSLHDNRQELKKHIMDELERVQIDMAAELSALRQLIAKLDG